MIGIENNQRGLTMKTTITLDNKTKEISIGLTKISGFYEELSLDSCSKWLYLDRLGDIDIPLLPDDHIIIHGGEKIVIGDIKKELGENPSIRNPICFKFNGNVIEEGIKKAKLNEKDICSLDTELNSVLLFVDLEDIADCLILKNSTLVIQEKDSYFTIPKGEDNSIDLEECAKKDRKPPKKQKSYKIKIDGKKYPVKKAEMTGVEILELAGKTYNDWSLNQKFHGGRRAPIGSEESVDFSKKGIERFETVRKQAQQGYCDKFFFTS